MERNKDNWTELYLDGALSGAELEAFLKELQNDKELQFTLAIHRRGRALLGQEQPGDETAFRQLLAEPAAQYFGNGTPGAGANGDGSARYVMFRRLAAAAAVIIAVFAGMSWYSSREYAAQSLLAQYYAPASTPATLSGEGYDRQDAFTAYRNKEYQKAVQLFEAVPPGNPLFVEAALFAGYAHFEAGQYAAAAEAFERVGHTGDARFAANAQWHRVLALLAAYPESPEALGLLDKIKNDPAHPFAEAAAALRAKLNSPLRLLAR